MDLDLFDAFEGTPSSEVVVPAAVPTSSSSKRPLSPHTEENGEESHATKRRKGELGPMIVLIEETLHSEAQWPGQALQHGCLADLVG